jgi:hypothetical protein
MLYHWLAASGFTTAALAELWARAGGFAAAMLVLWLTMALVVKLAGLRFRRQGLGSCVISAWVGLAGLAWPYYYTSMHSSGCKLDPTALLLSPVLVFTVASVRSWLGWRCGWRTALGLGLTAILALLLSTLTLAFVTLLALPQD